MATEFRLPDIGEGLTEGEIVRWLVEVGEPVSLDQPLVEVETAKAVVEIPSPVAGVLLHQGAAEGEVIEVGAILAVVGEPGEQWPPAGEAAPAPPVEAPLVGTISDEAEDLSAAPAMAAAPGRRPQALPVVRQLARRLGVDLGSIRGSGPGGRITRADVEAAANGERRPARPATAATGTGDERVRMTKLRRTIAEHMARSWAEIPHVTTFDRVDATRLLAARTALAARHDVSIPIEALVIKAVVPVLRAFREFNATLDGEDLVLRGSIDIGVAVDTPDGLLVPVVAGADRLSLLDVAARVDDLGARARSRTLTPAELTGGTFTVSNIGAVGGGYGTPIIPYGTVAILSVGRAEDQPVARAGQVVIAPMLPLSLSYDHRVIDGGLGRRFTATLIENLEEPALFLA